MNNQPHLPQLSVAELGAKFGARFGALLGEAYALIIGLEKQLETKEMIIHKQLAYIEELQLQYKVDKYE